MSDQPRALIVGCGRIAGGYNVPNKTPILTHAAAYHALNVRLSGCCDSNQEQAERFARQWGIEIFGSNLTDVLKRARPDVVSLCTPPQDRPALLKKILAFETVNAVLLEKPIADNLPEAEKVLALCHQHNKPVLVNYFRAFDPFYVELLEKYQAGIFGPLCEGVVRYYGSALTNASHLLERLLAMLGQPTGAKRLSGEKCAPVFEVCFRDSRVVFLPSSGCEYSLVEIDLFFKEFRLRIIDSENRFEAFKSKPDPHYRGFNTLAPTNGGFKNVPSPESITQAVRATLRAASGERSATDILDRAVQVNRILDHIGATVQ